MSQNLYEKLMGKYESCPDDPMAKFAKVGSYSFLFSLLKLIFLCLKFIAMGASTRERVQYKLHGTYFAFNNVIVAPFVFGDGELKAIFTRK